MRHSLTALAAMALLSSCLREQPAVPHLPVQQHITLPVEDFAVCIPMQGEFGHYVFHAPEDADSAQWFRISPGAVEAVGSGMQTDVPVNEDKRPVYCLAFHQADTAEHVAYLYHCYRFVLVPTAFATVRDGMNDYWHPFVQSLNTLEHIEWQVRAQDGTVLYRTGSSDGRWDGGYNGMRCPTGTYLYHIRVKFKEEPEMVLTGWFVKLG